MASPWSCQRFGFHSPFSCVFSVLTRQWKDIDRRKNRRGRVWTVCEGTKGHDEGTVLKSDLSLLEFCFLALVHKHTALSVEIRWRIYAMSDHIKARTRAASHSDRGGLLIYTWAQWITSLYIEDSGAGFNSDRVMSSSVLDCGSLKPRCLNYLARSEIEGNFLWLYHTAV